MNKNIEKLILSKYKKSTKKLNKLFKKYDEKNKTNIKNKLSKQDNKLIESLDLILEYLKNKDFTDENKLSFMNKFSLLKEKLDKKMNYNIFNEQHIKKFEDINKLLNIEEEYKSSAVDDFWNELAITQMAAGRAPSVITKNMRKALDGDDLAVSNIKKRINIQAAANKGFFHRAMEIRSIIGY